MGDSLEALIGSLDAPEASRGHQYGPPNANIGFLETNIGERGPDIGQRGSDIGKTWFGYRILVYGARVLVNWLGIYWCP